MYRFGKILALFLICVTLCACQSPVQKPVTETEPAFSSETLPFEFTVPDGYTLSAESSKSVSIARSNQVIGGIYLTDLHEVCITDSKCDHLSQYLKQFAPDPLMAEYIIMHDGEDAYVSLKITDPERGISTGEQSHHLFAKDEACFDFWVDTSTVSDEERDSIFLKIGEGSR